MKTAEELNVIKNEVETVSKKLAALTEDELAQISGGQMLIDNKLLSLNALNNVNRHANALAKNMERITIGQRINQETGNPISGAIDKHIDELKQRLDEQR